MTSMITDTLRGAVKSARMSGLLSSIAYVFDQARVAISERAEHFDEVYGTRTEGKTYPWQLSEFDANRIPTDACPYEALSSGRLREIIASLPICPADFTFIDLGSGKGRALLVACEFSFKRIVGVEISRELSDIAKLNIARFSSMTGHQRSIELRCIDATHYEFQNEPSLVFLFNPFGKPTFDAVISGLEVSLRANPRPLFVVYANPQHEARLASSDFIKCLKTGKSLLPWRQYVVYCSAACR
jgi:SAM-dependent methyltransferase